jgi:Uma2 family endonuclease
MAIATRVSVDEYLHTSYHPDREYVDGEVLERNVGTWDHSWLQRALLIYVIAREKELGVVIIQETRLKLGEKHYRIPDLMILKGGNRGEQIPSRPPFVCIEVLSPEDRTSRIEKKVADYLAFGVNYVWVLNPKTKQALVYTNAGKQIINDGVLRTEDPIIEIPLSQIFTD